MIELIRTIYCAKLTFKRKPGMVVVDIRPTKIGRSRRKELLIPEGISPEELSWTKYHHEIIAVYHRRINDNTYEYTDQMHGKAPTSLNQRLEQLVNDVCLDLYSNRK